MRAITISHFKFYPIKIKEIIIFGLFPHLTFKIIITLKEKEITIFELILPGKFRNICHPGGREITMCLNVFMCEEKPSESEINNSVDINRYFYS